MRIVSLLPSATETLFAIGAGADVVGVTFECDHPAEARERRVVSTSALPEGLAPAEIDDAVRRRIAAGEDLYHLDEGALLGLDADLVVTQDLCAVCAVDVSEVEDALVHLGCRAEVLTTDPQDLEEVWESVLQIGRASGRPEAAAEVVSGLRRRLDDVTRRVAGRIRPRTAVLEWVDPPVAPGPGVPAMVERAGGHSVLGTVGEQSVRTTWEVLAAAEPEVVVSAPCGFGLADSARLATDLTAQGVLPDGIPVWAVDANASFARPGPRLADGIEALAAVLHEPACGPPDPRLAQRVR